jgi:hypothetical protein
MKHGKVLDNHMCYKIKEESRTTFCKQWEIGELILMLPLVSVGDVVIRLHFP